ncbi:MAG: hypothetical protein K6A92_02385, partial [Lachnospiraceae bacterium]|nr:hypothetical protein [Lachnospiraceae bacterium]
MGNLSDYIYASIEVWGGLLCFIAWIVACMTRKANPRGGAAMAMMQFFSAVMLIADVTAWCNIGRPGAGFHLLEEVAYFIDFTFIYIDSILFVWYLSAFSEPDDTGRFLGF